MVGRTHENTPDCAHQKFEAGVNDTQRPKSLGLLLVRKFTLKVWSALGDALSVPGNNAAKDHPRAEFKVQQKPSTQRPEERSENQEGEW